MVVFEQEWQKFTVSLKKNLFVKDLIKKIVIRD